MNGEKTRFSSTYQPKNNGRKPAHLKRFLKDNNMGLSDVRAILGGILTNVKTIDDIKKMLTDPKTPPIVLFPLKALLKDYSTGRLDAFQFLAQYGYGMPKQEVEATNRNISAADMTREERDRLKIELVKKIIKENPEVLNEDNRD